MAREALGIVGAAIGGYFGGPQGAAIGFSVGSAVGGIIDPVHIDGPKLADAGIQTSRDGVPIPIGWGLYHVVGNIIQMNPIVETTRKVSQGKGGGPTTTETRRTRTFAIGISRGPTGPIPGLRRVWENNKLIYDTRTGTSFPAEDNQAFLDNTTLYLGTETQDPDPELETVTGVGLTPSYRGLPYIVFNNKDITDFGSSIPTYRFEIYPSCFEDAPQYRYYIAQKNSEVQYCRVDTVNRSFEKLATYSKQFVSFGDHGIACDGQYIAFPDGSSAYGANDLTVIKYDGTATMVATSVQNDLHYNGLFSFFGHGNRWVAAGCAAQGAGGTVGTWGSSGDTGSFIDFRWKWEFFPTPHPGYYTQSPNDIPCSYVMDFNIGTKDAYGDQYLWGMGTAHDTFDEWACSFGDRVLDGSVRTEEKVNSVLTAGASYDDSFGWDRVTGDWSVIRSRSGGNTTLDRNLITSGGSLSTVSTVTVPENIYAHSWHNGNLVAWCSDNYIRTFSISGSTATQIDELDLQPGTDGGIYDVALDGPDAMHKDPYTYGNSSSWFIVGESGGSGEGIAFQVASDGTIDPDYCVSQGTGSLPDAWGPYNNGVFFLDDPLTVTA